MQDTADAVLAHHPLETDAAGFQDQVIEASRRVPVLVDFWADWCAPCRMLAPVLEKLAADYGDRLRVVKVNTDREQELAASHGIRSLPTLRLYRHGEVVDEALGAQPESALRALIDPWIERPSDALLDAALEQAARGDLDAAWAALEETAETDPGNPRLGLARARVALMRGDAEAAGAALDALPAGQRDSDEADALRAQLRFARLAAGAPEAAQLEQRLAGNPDDQAARLQRAARRVLDGDHDAALDDLMEALQKQPRDHAARDALLDLFRLLGDDDPRVTRARRRMFALLH